MVRVHWRAYIGAAASLGTASARPSWPGSLALPSWARPTLTRFQWGTSLGGLVAPSWARRPRRASRGAPPMAHVSCRASLGAALGRASIGSHPSARLSLSSIALGIRCIVAQLLWTWLLRAAPPFGLLFFMCVRAFLIVCCLPPLFTSPWPIDCLFVQTTHPLALFRPPLWLGQCLLRMFASVLAGFASRLPVMCLASVRLF